MSSGTTTTRPRPKPRPAPKPKQSSQIATSSSTSAPTATTSTSSSSTAHQITYDSVQDDDEMFMRNRGRDRNAWAKLEKLNKAGGSKKKETVVVDSDSDNDDDGDDKSTTRSTKRQKSKKGKDNTTAPRWQTDQKFARFLSQDLSDKDSNSDSDSISIQHVGSQDNKLKRKRDGKHARRSRSKSITPPPAIPQYQLENAKEVIRQALGRSSPSMPDDDEDDYAEQSQDTVIFDPELARIAQSVKSQSRLEQQHDSDYHYGHDRGRSRSHNPRASSSVEPLGHGEEEGESESVNVTVKWQPHPLSQSVSGKQDVWGFKLDRKSNFSYLFDSVAEEANVLSDSLVLTFRGKRFFSSVTPQTLRIWGDVEFVACDMPTYDYMRKAAATHLQHTEQSRQQPASKSITTTTTRLNTTNTPRAAATTTTSSTTKSTKPKSTDADVIDIDSDDDDDIEIRPRLNQQGSDSEIEEVFVARSESPEYVPTMGGAGPATSTGGGNEGGDADNTDKFRLVLRSQRTGNNTDISLNVRSTTRCGAIVRAFLKKAGLVGEEYVEFMGGADSSSSSNANDKGKKKKQKQGKPQKFPVLHIDGEKVGNGVEIGDMDLEDGDLVEVVDL